MTLLEELKECTCNVEEGISRLMNNKVNYENMLKKLSISLRPLNTQVQAALEKGDKATAISGAYTIKGITENLSVTPLFNAYSEIVNLLRADKPDEAKQLYNETVPQQDKILAIIEKYV